VRYGLLETIREFGRERLQETGDYAALHRRHCDWYERLVHQAAGDWISPRQLDWMARLDREYPNLRAALEFSLSEPGEAAVGLRLASNLYVYWFIRGALSEGRLWLGRALARHTPPTADRVRAAFADSVLAYMQGDLAMLSARAEEVRDLAEQLDDASASALATYASGVLAGSRRDIARAIELVRRALDAFRAEGDIHLQVRALATLAVACGMLGDEARAVAYHEEVLAITEPRGDVWYRSLSLWALALAAWRQHDLPRAAERLEQSLHLKRRMDDPLGSAWCLEVMAWVAADEHRSELAATLLGAAAGLSRSVGTPAATFPDLLDHHEACEQQTRRILGDRAYQAAFRHGTRLSIDDAIAYAVGVRPDEAP